VTQTRVVVADDEPITRQDVVEMLTSLDYVVVGDVGDGRSAVNLARELKPDVIVMDIKMPILDGIDAARILTEEDICPVLLLTAYHDKELVDRAREAGVTAYLVKPFRESDLSPAIEVALARFQEFREMKKQLADLKDTLETRKLVDRAKGILMDTQGLTEADAFRRIQKMSMDTRRAMKDIAQAIVITHEAETRSTS
jgi:AmiR/NasT family two-component response regulator